MHANASVTVTNVSESLVGQTRHGKAEGRGRSKNKQDANSKEE